MNGNWKSNGYQTLFANMLTVNISLMHWVLLYAIASERINFEDIKLIQRGISFTNFLFHAFDVIVRHILLNLGPIIETVRVFYSCCWRCQLLTGLWCCLENDVQSRFLSWCLVQFRSCRLVKLFWIWNFVEISKLKFLQVIGGWSLVTNLLITLNHSMPGLVCFCNVFLMDIFSWRISIYAVAGRL